MEVGAVYSQGSCKYQSKFLNEGNVHIILLDETNIFIYIYIHIHIRSFNVYLEINHVPGTL
jgi:hypothetical protein